MQGLPQSGMLAVHGHNFQTCLTHAAHDELPTANEGFLIGKGYVFAELDRFEGIFQACKARRRHERHFTVSNPLFRRLFAVAVLHARRDLVGNALADFLVDERGVFGKKLFYLL